MRQGDGYPIYVYIKNMGKYMTDLSHRQGQEYYVSEAIIRIGDIEKDATYYVVTDSTSPVGYWMITLTQDETERMFEKKLKAEIKCALKKISGSTTTDVAYINKPLKTIEFSESMISEVLT